MRATKPPKLKRQQCHAKSKQTGNQCKSPAIEGGTVCRIHGGSSGHVIRKAKERLMLAADPAAAVLVEQIRKIKGRTDSDRRMAAIAILDRTGHGPTSRHELTGKDGGPIQTVDVSIYTNEEIAIMRGIFQAAIDRAAAKRAGQETIETIAVPAIAAPVETEGTNDAGNAPA